MSQQSQKLGDFLREVCNWDWGQFVRAEKNMNYTSNQAIIFALIRACAMQQLSAIKTSISRLDGKLETPVKFEYPKVFYLFPNATIEETDDEITTIEPTVNDNEVTEIVPAAEPEPEIIEVDLPSMGLREMLTLMSDYPRELPAAVIVLADATHMWVQGNGPEPEEIPKVKSVVAAHLLAMAQNRNLDAINEVFDQIDGKLVETIRVIGDDLYITSYASVAPPDAKLNANGVLQAEATTVQNMWAEKLAKLNKGAR